jgi:hypothetical protein
MSRKTRKRQVKALVKGATTNAREQLPCRPYFRW